MSTVTFRWAPTMALGVLALSFVGCGSGDNEEATEYYYKPTGSLQCSASQSTPANLSALATSLANAGVTVSGIKCGTDGNAHAAACGVATDEIWLVSTVNAPIAAMRSLGFALASDLPAAKEKSCTGGA